MAAQDQAISTNYFKNKILKEEIESKCRLCKQHEETIEHLISGCPILAKNEYLMRHDKVCSHLHYSICKALGIETTDKWYTHTCPLDVAIPAYRNVVQKEAEKKLKYKSLCIEIQRMWNLKCTIIPVIIGATGIVTRSLRKNLEAVPGKHSIDSLQKTAILGTSHIIRKVLQCEA